MGMYPITREDKKWSICADIFFFLFMDFFSRKLIYHGLTDKFSQGHGNPRKFTKYTKKTENILIQDTHTYRTKIIK